MPKVYVQSMPNIFPKDVQNQRISKETVLMSRFSQSVSGKSAVSCEVSAIPKECPKYAKNMPKVCKKYAQSILKGCPKDAQRMPKVFPKRGF